MNKKLSELDKYRKEQIKIAKELCLSNETIERMKQATTETMIDSIKRSAILSSDK